MLTGVHVLLTLKCTNECEHCFLHCGPSREGTFTIEQLRTLICQTQNLGTVNTVYFEGGEPFLFYPLLLEGLRMARAAGFDSGVVTNGYWATSVEDALHWLRPVRDLNVADFSVSDDEFHRRDKNDRRADFARQAAEQLGIPTGAICIEPPSVSRQADQGQRGKPVVGGSVLFKGRAAEKLTAGLPVCPAEELRTCPHEDLLSPERVHVDAYGNVHLCQGLSMGNIWENPLSDLVRGYDAQKHPDRRTSDSRRTDTARHRVRARNERRLCRRVPSLLHGTEITVAALSTVFGTQGIIRALAQAHR